LQGVSKFADGCEHFKTAKGRHLFKHYTRLSIYAFLPVERLSPNETRSIALDLFYECLLVIKGEYTVPRDGGNPVLAYLQQQASIPQCG